MTDLAITENDLQTYDEYIDFLEHHGILGMKWGHQNGPPYPLDAGDHSASERKAGWRKSLSSAASGVATVAKKTKAAIQVVKAKHDEKKQIKEEEKAQKKIEDKNEAVKSGNPLKIAEYSSQMSIQEYREAVDRLDLQRRLNMYLPPDKAKLTMGEKLDRARQGVDKFATNVQNGINTYNKVAKLSNTLFKTDLPVLDKSALERAEAKAKEEREKELKIWQDQSKLAASKSTVARVQDEFEKRAKAKQDEEIKRAWEMAEAEDVYRTGEKRRQYERDVNDAYAENTRRNAEAAETARRDAENKRKQLESDWDSAIEENNRRNYRQNMSDLSYESDKYARTIENMASETKNLRFDDTENSGYRYQGYRTYESAVRNLDDVERYGFSHALSTFDSYYATVIAG